MTGTVATQQPAARPAPDDVVEAARCDPRPRFRRLVAPLATAAAVAVACGYLFAVDPNAAGHYPVCPTRALLGIDCPGCGLMRGTYALLHGDIPAMLDHNILLALFIPFAVVMWIGWLRRAWTGFWPAVTYRQFRRRTRWSIIALVLVIAFGVVRNFVPYLGSGA